MAAPLAPLGETLVPAVEYPEPADDGAGQQQDQVMDTDLVPAGMPDVDDGLPKLAMPRGLAPEVMDDVAAMPEM